MKPSYKGLQETVADPVFYQLDAEVVARTLAEPQELEADLAKTYKRWEELEEKFSFLLNCRTVLAMTLIKKSKHSKVA